MNPLALTVSKSILTEN